MADRRSSQPTSLNELGEIDDLRRQIDALAEANVRAAELMVELDEARAVGAALERRAEELGCEMLVMARRCAPRRRATGPWRPTGPMSDSATRTATIGTARGRGS